MDKEKPSQVTKTIQKFLYSKFRERISLDRSILEKELSGQLQVLKNSKSLENELP
jgi:hypothetical protein